MQYKMKTNTWENGIIEQELYSILDDDLADDVNLFNSTSQRISRWVMDTKEESIRQALIQLGWTPPKEQEI